MSARKPVAVAGAVPRGEASGVMRIPGAFPAANGLYGDGQTQNPEEVKGSRAQGREVHTREPAWPAGWGQSPAWLRHKHLGVENRIPVRGESADGREKTPIQPAAGWVHKCKTHGCEGLTGFADKPHARWTHTVHTHLFKDAGTPLAQSAGTAEGRPYLFRAAPVSSWCRSVFGDQWAVVLWQTTEVLSLVR